MDSSVLLADSSKTGPMTPRFETVISARGPDGNTYAILGLALGMMRQLGIEASVRTDLSVRVRSAASYKEACDVIREWFPVETD